MRLYKLGKELAQRYLAPSDLLIAIIGNAGAGKSTLIKGLFPGLELTNDDSGVNVKSTPLFTFSEDDFFSGHTFHIDYLYEKAFHQRYEIVDAINRAIDNNRRVVVEHFDLLYPYLAIMPDHLRDRGRGHRRPSYRIRAYPGKYSEGRRQDPQVPAHGTLGRGYHQFDPCEGLPLS